MVEPSAPSHTLGLHSTGRIVKGAIALLLLGAVAILAALEVGPVGLAIVALLLFVVIWVLLYQWQLHRGLTTARELLQGERMFSAAGVEGDLLWWLGRAVLVAASPSETVALRMSFTRIQMLWRAPCEKVRLLQLLPARRSSKWSIEAEGHRLTLRTSKEEAAEAASFFVESV